MQEELQFFFTERGKLKRDVISQIIKKLEKLHEVLARQDRFYFYSSSLLVIYDKTLKIETEEIIKIQKTQEQSESIIFQNGSPSWHTGRKYLQTAPVKADVRLIDFTHSVDKNNVSDKFDGNTSEVLDAIRNLITYLNQMMK